MVIHHQADFRQERLAAQVEIDMPSEAQKAEPYSAVLPLSSLALNRHRHPQRRECSGKRKGTIEKGEKFLKARENQSFRGIVWPERRPVHGDLGAAY